MHEPESHSPERTAPRGETIMCLPFVFYLVYIVPIDIVLSVLFGALAFRTKNRQLKSLLKANKKTLAPDKM